MSASILDEVQEYLLDEEFAKSFDRFADEYAPQFDPDSDENKLIYTEIYNKFCKLFESQLEEFLKSKNYTTQEFFEACKELQDEEGGESEFVQLIIALGEYDVFLTMMKGQAERRRDE